MPDDQDASLTRSEEELRVDRSRRPAGAVGIHKTIETSIVEEDVPRRREAVGDIARTDVSEDDSGEVEVLEDGSVSIPILEEELVVSRRLVVRERVIVTKVTETQIERIRAELRREQIDVEVDEGLLADDDST